MSHQAGHGQILALLASLVSLAALLLPVFGSALVTQKVVRTVVAKGLSWSHGNPGRRLAMAIAGAAVIAGAVWAWWPAGQYQPVREDQKGTPPRRDQARLRPRRGGPAHDEPGAGVAHAGRASGPWR